MKMIVVRAVNAEGQGSPTQKVQDYWAGRISAASPTTR